MFHGMQSVGKPHPQNSLISGSGNPPFWVPESFGARWATGNFSVWLVVCVPKALGQTFVVRDESRAPQSHKQTPSGVETTKLWSLITIQL